MALQTCATCTAAYAVGLASCPHCQITERGDGMAKISRAGVSYGPDDTRPVVPLKPGEPYMVHGGIAGASGLEVLKVPAEGAQAEVPESPEPEPEPTPAQTAPRVPPRRSAPPAPPAGA